MKKIVLIGDSIRQGYGPYVKMAFEGMAEVYYPRDNCRFASYILRHLIDWKRDMECGDDVDVVHFNAGLWDDLVMVDGKHHTPIEHYRENIERVCDVIRILFPQAKIIFATTTPVQEELFTGLCKRFNADTRRYNEVATEAVLAKGGEINDLYSILDGCPKSYYSDLTHLYTKDGTQLLTDRVIAVLEEATGVTAKKLDYAEIFREKEKAIGI